MNLIYDRFLPCESPHGRRQLQRRRENTFRAGGPRLRDSSTSRIQNNVETLYERFDRHTINDESLMIAAFLTLREATAFSSGRTLEPQELLPLQRRLQFHMREMMDGDYEEESLDQLVELIFARHADFMSRMEQITPIRSSVDLVESIKAVMLRFLNEAMTVLDMDSIEMYSRRFRIIYPRMFYELCGVLSYCCLEGIEGLRWLYRSFISDLVQNIDEPVRDLLYSLAMENLNTAISRIETNKVHCAKFIQRKSSSLYDSSDSSLEAAMDVFDPTYSRSEAMERFPDDIEEFHPYPSDSPPGLISTITTLVNPSSGIPPTSTPIVPTVTTIPNVSSYQTLTTTHSVPIVPTAPIIPTISVIPSSPTSTTMDTVPIAYTVPMVPTVSFHSPRPVLLPVPPIISPTIPTTPIPRQYIERSGASPIASYSNEVQSSSFAYSTARHNHRNNPTNENNHNNPASPPLPDDGSNLRFVPPAQIAQHWGEDWVPTFTRDMQQQSASTEPYSDAYLTGMPPKKRRCVRESRPPTTLDGLIDDSVGEISEQMTSHTELRAAFREKVRALARDRAAADDDYEPERMVATARFVKQPRSNTRKSTETQSSGDE